MVSIISTNYKFKEGFRVHQKFVARKLGSTTKDDKREVCVVNENLLLPRRYKGNLWKSVIVLAGIISKSSSCLAMDVYSLYGYLLSITALNLKRNKFDLVLIVLRYRWKRWTVSFVRYWITHSLDLGLEKKIPDRKRILFLELIAKGGYRVMDPTLDRSLLPVKDGD
ncbi:hypothetical protein Tco_0954843 [Tanacetum coccineum]|uniref:Uncharacterized protein n=1 Tax=Tanacetum coccineum TaxID=301880 RepID=A0ABQ5E5I0_9ASTR